MDKSLKYRLVVWAAALFLIFLIPGGINASSQIQKTSIATAIGIDKTDNQLEVSVQVVVPDSSTNYSPKYVIASAKGQNLPKAIENIELKLGQEIGLAHCFVIVFGNSACESDDLADTLDFLLRSNIMGNNSALLHTESTAKKLLEESSKLSESDVNNLQNIAKYNQEHYSSSNTNLISFFNSYLSKCPFCVVGSLNPSEENKQNQTQNTQTQQNSNQTQPKVLNNEGKAVVLKKGKKIATLNKDDLTNFGWLDPKAQKGFLILKNVTNNIFTNATITLHIKNKSIKFEAQLKNQKPVLVANIFFEAFVESVQQNSTNQIGTHQNLCSEDFKAEIETTVKENVAKALEISKENNFDIINAFNIFNAQKHTEWKNYLKTLETPDDYIQNMEIVANVSMHNKL